MLDLLFTDHAAWFGVPAVVGTFFFVLRMVMMFVGGDLHGDLDAAGVDLHHGDPAEAFKVLSLQSIAAFLMGFGWGGLAGLHGADWSWQASTLLAFGCGVGMLWLLGMMFRAIFSLQASGNVAIEDTVGVEADVYVTVPGERSGRGQVQVVVDNRQRTYNAITEGQTLPTRSRVRITRVNDDHTVTVTPV